MDGLDEDDLKTPVFEHLGVFENVDFEQIDQFYRYVDPTRGTDITVPHGPEAAIDAYAAAFPEENAGIRKFINVILTTRREVADWPFFEEPSSSTTHLHRFGNEPWGDTGRRLSGSYSTT
ncbi:hypothetical protein [Halovenus salina]|uniref:Uncharacterized protein n=2 Tax=Halovenus salina TaxID=1510225 RepID=A0ABD5W942_9EURY